MKNKLMNCLPLVCIASEIGEDHSWMYNGSDKEGKYTDE
jgi:hypothetical protein